MAPGNGTQQWHQVHSTIAHYNGTLQWHHVHSTIAHYNGTLQRHPAMAPRPAPCNGILVPRPMRKSGSSPPPPIGSKNPYSYRYLGKHVKPSPRYGLIIHFHSPSLNIPKPSTINRQTHPSRAKVGTVSRSWPWAFRSEAPSSPPNQQQTAGGTAQHTTTPGEDRVA